ncbi:hypothetical protein FRC08_003600 [Ceratobasidium sp. 394]|nr:hypothetical protein FRC08_003600 [Ceratobasidium sp. 394]KAG9084691.1 hypothetical protein FS749_005032 [Ceratobasidium sp. UAMH 11750]
MALHSIDTRPLSPSELTILLALPRAAEATPNATFFKIPRGPDPTLGFVDVTCAEAAAIVSRLAATWDVRLSNLGLAPSEKVGLNIGIAVEPCVHSFFHHLAFWALGCCVQYVDTGFEPGLFGRLLESGDCAALIYSGDNLGGLAHEVGERLKIPLIELPKEEHAINLATKEKAGARPAPSWPTPRRPTPSVIIHSSSSTGNPKLLRLSLQYWAQSLESHSELIASSGPQNSDDTKRTRLLASSPFWHTFNNILVLHLATRVPVALVHKPNLASLMPSEILDWLVASKAGQVVTPALYAREMLGLAFNPDGTIKQEEWAMAMRGLNSLGITGSDVDSVLSELFVKCNVKAMNLFGTSELGGLLLSTRPPYHYLRPYPDIPPPLAVPLFDSPSSTNHKFILDAGECSVVSQPRLVQLWTLVSSHPRLAHMVAENNAPLEIEPYPGPGPLHGQPATKWSDLFYQVQITRDPAANPEVAYVHAGRTDDFIRLSSSEGINASEVELALSAAIRAKLDGLNGWELDIDQVFGTNRPHTALVVQLRRLEAGTGASSSERVIEDIREAVEGVNKELKLIKEVQIDAYRRVLVVTESGELLGQGKYEKVFEDTQPILSMTHKHTLQRWINVQTFEPWLEQVCGVAG